MIRAAVGGRARLGASALAAAVALAAGVAFAAEEGTPAGLPPPEPTDYKMDDYRSPTPLTLSGARVVDTGQAEALWRAKGAVFVDTMPRDARPASLPPGTVWRDKPRDNIPGSAWLANVGYGAIAPDMTNYFRSSLAALSDGDMAKPILFYCRADCWMSWNAAKRAMSWGYRDVSWYPAGTDGWAGAGLGLEPAKPYASPERSEPPKPGPSQ